MVDHLTLPKNTFYILEITPKGSGGQKTMSIHVEMPTAIDIIREAISKDTPTENISLMRVEIQPKQLSATGIPWSVLAVELIKAVKK
jgi:hypothetical protein